ncbi:MAG TPA: sulfotransferase [Allosphingosinicella sp.]
MKLTRPLLRLPIRFDAARLSAEIEALPVSAWHPHPNKLPGNEAVHLVTPGGRITDSVAGAMAPTEHLKACPYILEVMAELGAVWGRARLMRLAPGAVVPPHVDVNYYWRTHLRLHIPILTEPEVEFGCGGETVHMAAGECWLFDTFQWHEVRNGSERTRVHLVLDTVGGERLWELIEQAQNGAQPSAAEARREMRQLAFEKVNAPPIMSPWEIRCHIAFLAEEAVAEPPLGAVLKRLDRFVAGWTAAWAEHGPGESGLPAYRRLIEVVRTDLAATGGEALRLRNDVPFYQQLAQLVFNVAVPAAAPARATSGSPIERPIFIVGAPRSGSSLLFLTMAGAPGLYTIRGESHQLIEGLASLHPRAHGWESNRLTEADATPEIAAELAARFYARLVDRERSPAEGAVRMLEKTPKNSLRVAFLNAVFPDAHFVYLYRDARETLSSMVEAWASGGFRTYPELPDWPEGNWSLLLVPGWRALKGRPLPEIAARQWATTTRILLDDLTALPPERVKAISYTDLVASPQATIASLCAALDVRWDRELGPTLPPSPTVVSPPRPDKWRRNEGPIDRLWPIMAEEDARARAFLARHRA